nr:Y-family DNA polymerase [Pseudopedobacter sp.]
DSMKKMWGLADGINFYASCERLFRPDLAKSPIAVLSNNDGCVIARSAELKALGIKMGTPEFEIRKDIKAGKIIPFSSNYELYGEMHNRLMHTLSRFTPEWEIYSVDECWLLFKDFDYDMKAYAKHIVNETWNLVGIPISIGIAPTKTLAKVANKLAKKDKQSGGALVLNDDHEITIALSQFPVEELWGVGHAKAKRLAAMGVRTALEFRLLPGEWVKKHFTITGFRMWRELHGEACLELADEGKNKEAIATGRSFGKLLTNYQDVKEALVNHASNCASKLRKQKSLAGYIDVQIETSRFRNDLAQYVNHITMKLLQPTNDSSVIVKTAIQGLDKIWREKYHYNRCGAMLLDLRDESTGQQEALFETHNREKSNALMKALDSLNSKHGKNTVKLAAQGNGKNWALRRQYLSPRYLTRLNEFLKLKQ